MAGPQSDYIRITIRLWPDHSQTISGLRSDYGWIMVRTLWITDKLWLDHGQITEENHMDKERMKEIALEEGFADTEVIPVEKLVFCHEYRRFCEQNDCGNYGKNYACPPACGEPWEMEEKVKKYKYAAVFCSRTQVKDAFDSSETKKVKKMHTAMTLKVLKRYAQEGMQDGGLSIMAGPCNFCDTCRMQEGEACVHEDMRFSCLSAYCIDASALAKSCGIEISWDGNAVSFFSLYCFG